MSDKRVQDSIVDYYQDGLSGKGSNNYKIKNNDYMKRANQQHRSNSVGGLPIMPKVRSQSIQSSQ